MTDPVILYGTQSNGESLPVQKDRKDQKVRKVHKVCLVLRRGLQIHTRGLS